MLLISPEQYKKITVKKILVLIAFSLPIILNAQKSDVSPLFGDKTPLDIKLKVSFKDIKKKTNDSTYLPSVLQYKNTAGSWDSLKIGVRSRGIFRRENCYFTPLRLKIGKGDAKGNLFEGNKSLKLVLPCQNNDGKNPLVLKEYICYKMYEIITPYYFNTRLVNIALAEVDGKKTKNAQLTGILIEDDDIVAKRHQAKVIEMKLHPRALADTASLYHDIFQFMIGNTDWSTAFQHNAKLIFKEPRIYIPLTYDFDMSGFVDAPYSVVSPELGIANVRERLYRGFCRKEPVVQAVRQHFLKKEPEIMAIIDSFEKEFNPKDFKIMRKYIEDFYVIMKNDAKFNLAIVQGCRNQ